jgi:hypothetical protein
MSRARCVVSCLGLFMTASCASAGIPIEAPVTASSVTVTLPRDLEDSDGPLKGLNLLSIDRVTEQEGPFPGAHYTNNTIKDFFSVQSTVSRPGQLTTRVCQGEQYDDGKREKSCVTYEARLTFEEAANQVRITLTPFKMVTQQGRNAIGVSEKLPRVDIADWYLFVTAQSVASRYKLTSKYGPESIKANFDRHLERHDFDDSAANAALRQFKDTYLVDAHDGTTARVGASFYPYRDGTMVEIYISLAGEGGKGDAARRDWSASLSSLKAELDKIAND